LNSKTTSNPLAPAADFFLFSGFSSIGQNIQDNFTSSPLWYCGGGKGIL
jgi:hypothetical protein